MESFYKKWQDEVAKEEIIKKEIEKAEKILEEKDSPEIMQNIMHFKHKLESQSAITINRKKPMISLNCK